MNSLWPERIKITDYPTHHPTSRSGSYQQRPNYMMEPLNIGQAKWDVRFLDFAAYMADSCSKDPSTKVGAIIADSLNRLVSFGYNGFPRGVADTEARYADRPMKYQLVVHAEPNAILNAARPVDGCALYCTLLPCNECAKVIIQAGITRVVAPGQPAAGGRWDEAHEVSLLMFGEAGVIVQSPDVVTMG